MGPAMIESDYDKVKAMFSNYPNISWPNDHDRQNQPQAMGKDRATLLVSRTTPSGREILSR